MFVVSAGVYGSQCLIIRVECHMVKLTRELIEKAEHHEDILPTLEELSLHQLEIEKIEVVGIFQKKSRYFTSKQHYSKT